MVILDARGNALKTFEKRLKIASDVIISIFNTTKSRNLTTNGRKLEPRVGITGSKLVTIISADLSKKIS
jgi:hypothetical protein